MWLRSRLVLVATILGSVVVGKRVVNVSAVLVLQRLTAIENVIPHLQLNVAMHTDRVQLLFMQVFEMTHTHLTKIGNVS